MRHKMFRSNTGNRGQTLLLRQGFHIIPHFRRQAFRFWAQLKPRRRPMHLKTMAMSHNCSDGYETGIGQPYGWQADELRYERGPLVFLP